MSVWFKRAIVTGVLGSTLFAAPLWATTLTDALVLTYQTNPQLVISRTTLRQSDEGVLGARSALRPDVSASASASKTVTDDSTGPATGSLSVTVKQLLYDGGASKLGVEAARYAVLSDRQALVSTEQDVLLDAVIAYMDVRRDLQFVRLAENNVRVLGEQVRAAKDRFEVGEVTRTDVSQAEARLAAAVSNLERNKALLRISEQTYKAVVGNMPKNLQSPPNPPQIPATAQDAENLAVSRHPRILGAQFDVQAAELAVERAKLNRRPTVSGSLSAGRGFNTANEDAELTASITGSVPLYKGGRLNSDRRAAMAALERSKAVVQLQALITRQAVNSAHANWQASRAAIESGKEQVRAAQIAFDGVSEEARLGARTTLDVLDAEQDLLDARSSLISASRDEQVAAYTVLSEMGLMTASHLNLGVDAYDPDVNYTAVNGRKSPQAARFKLLDKLQNR